VSVLLFQIRHSAFVEECFDHLLKDVHGSKAQRTSGTARLVHQEGYVVTKRERNGRIEVVVDALPESDVFLSFSLVPIGEVEVAEVAQEKKTLQDNDVEITHLLNVAVHLAQLCIRCSWKVPTQLQKEKRADVPASQSGTQNSLLTHRSDVMYTIVQACRHFFNNKSRSDGAIPKNQAAIAMCENIKNGLKVTEGLSNARSNH